MPWIFNIFLDKHRSVSKAVGCFTNRTLHLSIELLRAVYNTHPFSTTASTGFDHNRKPYLCGQFFRAVYIRNLPIRTGYERHVKICYGSFCTEFVAHDANGVRTRPDEYHPCLFYRFSKSSVFTQESIARMYGIYT